MKRIASVLAIMIVAATAVAAAQQANEAQAPNTAVPWEKHKQGSNEPTLEFQASEPMTLYCELQFDAFEQKQADNAGRDCAPAPELPASADRPHLTYQGGESSLPGDRVKDTGRQIGPNWGAPSGFSVDRSEIDNQSKGASQVQGSFPAEQRTFSPSDFRFALPSDTPDDDDDDDDDDGGTNGN